MTVPYVDWESPVTPEYREKFRDTSITENNRPARYERDPFLMERIIQRILTTGQQKLSAQAEGVPENTLETWMRRGHHQARICEYDGIYDREDMPPLARFWTEVQQAKAAHALGLIEEMRSLAFDRDPDTGKPNPEYRGLIMWMAERLPEGRIFAPMNRVESNEKREITIKVEMANGDQWKFGKNYVAAEIEDSINTEMRALPPGDDYE